MAATTTMMIPASSFLFFFLPKSYISFYHLSVHALDTARTFYTIPQEGMILMIFLGLFIFFVCMFAYLRHKSTAAEEAAAESFWNRENEANHTRRKDISGLPYITIPLADFPMGIYDNPE